MPSGRPVNNAVAIHAESTPAAAEPRLEYASRPASAPGSLCRFLLSPVGWPLIAVAAGISAWALYLGAWSWFSLNFEDVGPAFLALCMLGVFGTWLVRFAVAAVVARRWGRPQAYPWHRWVRWSLPPAVLGLATGAIACRLPATIAFRLNRPAMERAAATVVANPSASPPPVSIGIYGMSTPTVVGGCVVFPVSGMWANSVEGFGYDPGGRPSGSGPGDHLSGPWYVWGK